MRESRLLRLSRRVAALEEFKVYPYSGDDSRILRDLKVVKKKRTKDELERAFRLRKIPIRIFYGSVKDFPPSHKPGVITFQYEFVPPDPPTSWMIIHNLSHAIFNPRTDGESDNPHMFNLEERWTRQDDMSNRVINLNLLSEEDYDEEEEDEIPTYPDVNSYRTGRLTESFEAFHELFTQWVITGKVQLMPDNALNKQRSLDLAKLFRGEVDSLAKAGMVLVNTG